MKINHFKYDEIGLNRFFGSLEAKVMELLWDAEELCIKDVQHKLAQDKPVNFNTVMTVMNRLVEKGILQRRLQGRLSLYRPTQSKEIFIEEQSRKLTENLIDEFGGVVINHMLDAIKDVDESLIQQLEAKLRQLKKDSQ
ncbi:BlaI/MecI/CopY family transcriptional regulator [Paenibacillus sp. 2TAB19]|jgi:predicted transcriptional regulator|uniref:BlaI/MecI/CopY family transcriptional regulator n=1 Tax=Paenibacillus sp. 2TAB19 TaxID=3233003 RepID=UPI003F98A559